MDPILWLSGADVAATGVCDLEQTAGIVQEARRRGVFRVEDMALYSHEEQEEKWNGWCRDYFGEPQS